VHVLIVLRGANCAETSFAAAIMSLMNDLEVSLFAINVLPK